MNETITELAWSAFRQQIEPELAKKRRRWPNTVPEAEWHKPKHLRDAWPNIPSIYDEDEP
jgi:mRNA-degrading endonuclease HigB of HigAB toxin-antitoxin module